jgi:hypothetical protein
MVTNEEIDKIIGECIPLPRSCKLEIQRAERRREKLKSFIVDNFINFGETCANESAGIRAEENSENAFTSGNG